MRDLENYAVVVTGAGRGLGRAYALAVAEAGAKVVVNDIDAAEAESVAAEIADAGGVAQAFVGSVADWAAAEALIEHCAQQFGSVDGLVNNAGVEFEAAPWEDTEAGVRAMIEVNVVGSLFPGIHAIRQMKRQGSGSIVNIVSGAQLGILNKSAYGATKGAMQSATIGWALEALPYGIRVNAVSPVAKTRMMLRPEDYPDVAEPSDIAPAVVYLLSAKSARITGQTVRLAGRELSVLRGATFPEEPLDQDSWTVESITKAFEETLNEQTVPVGLYAPRIDVPLKDPVPGPQDRTTQGA